MCRGGWGRRISKGNFDTDVFAFRSLSQSALKKRGGEEDFQRYVKHRCFCFQEFIPERFEKEAFAGKDPYLFVPFSAGPRYRRVSYFFLMAPACVTRSLLLHISAVTMSNLSVSAGNVFTCVQNIILCV